MFVTSANGNIDYNVQCDSMDSTAANTGYVVRRRSVKSERSVHLNGPMEIQGRVESMSSASLQGDIAVRGKIEAYGNLVVRGNVTCQDRIKSFGNVDIAGYVCCAGKVKIFGKLTIYGHFEVHDDIEVWGAVVLQGQMTCRNLIAYASVTTVGDGSFYQVAESETVWGAKLTRRFERGP